MEKDSGRLVYDVEFYTSKMEYDVEIDAYTGAILDYDCDKIDDDDDDD